MDFSAPSDDPTKNLLTQETSEKLSKRNKVNQAPVDYNTKNIDSSIENKAKAGSKDVAYQKFFTENDLRDSQIYNDQSFEKENLIGQYHEHVEEDQPRFIEIDSKMENDQKPSSDIKFNKENSKTSTEPEIVVHEVQPDDTIERLCIQYNVNKDVIRKANEFSGEEIYMFKTLKIPRTRGKLYDTMNQTEEERKNTLKLYAID